MLGMIIEETRLLCPYIVLGSIISGITDGLMYAVEGPIITCTPGGLKFRSLLTVIQLIQSRHPGVKCWVCGYLCDRVCLPLDFLPNHIS
jgi:hypothetical protein